MVQYSIYILGSIDKYIMHSKYKFLKQSQFAMFLRKLIKKKIDDPKWVVPERLPLSFKGSERRFRKQVHELKGIPSIYIPPEAKSQDLSEMYYRDSETRWEKDRKQKLLKEVNYYL